VEEALDVFSTVINKKAFAQSKIILCFTKMDIFQAKLAAHTSTSTSTSSLATYFPDYNGLPMDAEAAKMFFTEKFTNLLAPVSDPADRSSSSSSSTELPRHMEIDVCYLNVTDIDDVWSVLGQVFETDGGALPANFVTMRKRCDYAV
jgi:hypothetical protein